MGLARHGDSVGPEGRWGAYQGGDRARPHQYALGTAKPIVWGARTDRLRSALLPPPDCAPWPSGAVNYGAGRGGCARNPVATVAAMLGGRMKVCKTGEVAPHARIIDRLD